MRLIYRLKLELLEVKRRPLPRSTLLSGESGEGFAVEDCDDGKVRVGGSKEIATISACQMKLRGISKPRAGIVFGSERASPYKD